MSWAASGFLTAGGKSLEYACWGPPPGAAPTLVMLHEGLGCVALWRDIPQRLADMTGWGVCAYSRQGYGQSEAVELPLPLDYMTREACEVLPEVLDAIGFQHGALLGHSDGATIAAIHAGREQDARVAGVLLIAPHFFAEPGGLAAIAAARTEFATGSLREKLARYHRDVDCAFGGWNGAWLDPDFASWSVRDVLDGITCPVLAIQDDADPYGTLAQIDVIADRCRAEVRPQVLHGAGHAPHLTQPEVVLPEIVRFISQLEKL